MTRPPSPKLLYVLDCVATGNVRKQERIVRGRASPLYFDAIAGHNITSLVGDLRAAGMLDQYTNYELGLTDAGKAARLVAHDAR